jgi:hypothetical protein
MAASFKQRQSHQMICKLKKLGSIQGGFFLVHAEVQVCIYLFVECSDLQQAKYVLD